MRWVAIFLAALLTLSQPAIAARSLSDGKAFSNISATTAAFALDGGIYSVDVVATFGGGSVTLQKLSADGSTYVTIMTAFTVAGTNAAYLPRGTYRFTIATASAIYITIMRVQGE